MKRLSAILAVLALIIVTVSFWQPWGQSMSPPTPDSVIDETTGNYPPKTPITERSKPRGGPELEQWYFEEWHYPYGAVLDRGMLDDTWEAIRALPEEDRDRAVNFWEAIGPYGMTNAGGGRFTGRVLDIDATGASSLRLAAATGGLWSYYLIFPYPMSEGLSSQVVGSFSTHPSDENTILLGTGEALLHAGTGLWKTTDAGGTWYHVPMNPEPSGFFRIRHAPDGNHVYAATTQGIYRSTDGGETWTRTKSGWATDLVIEPGNPSHIWVPFWDEGLWKSINDGQSFYQMTEPGSRLRARIEAPLLSARRTPTSSMSPSRTRVMSSMASIERLMAVETGRTSHRPTTTWVDKAGTTTSSASPPPTPTWCSSEG